MRTSRDEARLGEYIDKLKLCLTPLPAAERDDIAEEIRVHVRERLATDPMLTADDILRRLGSPSTLARQYHGAQMLERASRSYSPFLMLRATVRWALTGVQGFLVFNIATLGYALGAGFILLAMLKLIFPDTVGLWLAPGIFEFGFRPGDRRLSVTHELLGDWFAPVTVGLGLLFTMGTTKLLRIVISRFGRLRFRLSSTPRDPLMA